jgi:hypothetical protein
MTEEDVVDAVDFAYELLKKNEPRWDRESGHEQAMSWKQLMVCPTVGGEVVERHGFKLVYDRSGQLVPRLGGLSWSTINYHHIYDDDKGVAF